jgi:Protein of unknown function (DUF3500)
MLEDPKPYCPECEQPFDPPEVLDRRRFIRVVGERTAALAALGGLAAATPRLLADDARPQDADRAAKPAEALIRELYASLSSDQKQDLVYPWDHVKAGRKTPTRLGMYNAPIFKTIEKTYTKPQQELVERILRAICSDEDGYRQISRNGNFDNSRSLQNCGAYIFGEPADDKKFAWVFTGHHLTVRCDGNSEEGAAFGGPMYYGHSPNGYSERNIFYYQTKSVLSVYDALSERQRKVAVVTGTPGEGEGSVRLRPKAQQHPGISFGELNKDQQALVEKVMRDVLSPYRKEDADEVMDIIKETGGLAKIHLAFYQDREMNDDQRWHFWRLEGPGFVWNYRVLPHVHTYVNISSRT